LHATCKCHLYINKRAICTSISAEARKFVFAASLMILVITTLFLAPHGNAEE